MELRKFCVSDINWNNKRVVIRSDFDVPIENGEVSCNDRILAAFATIKYIIRHNCHSMVILSHLGSPDGRRDPEFSLRQVVDELDRLLSREFAKKVLFVDDMYDAYMDGMALNPPRGVVLLFENMQYYIEEIRMTNDRKRYASRESIMRFHRHLKRYADVYVNDTFRYSHLPHASIAPYFIGPRVAGLAMSRELQYFHKIVGKPQRPIIAILAGNRIVDKLRMMSYLLERIDELIIGGAVAYTFLKETAGMEIGDTLYVKNAGEIVNGILGKADDYAVKVHLPEDFIMGDINDPESAETVTVEKGIPKGKMGLDIATLSTTMGVIEAEEYCSGTMGIMYAVSYASKHGATSIVVGEDTSMFCQRNKCLHNISHTSMGRAGEELLMGRMLPGVQALRTKGRCKCRFK
ncbi:hypothetical protein R5R35_000424 [Gryllus longicercus]|uniref:Phosphoglycerate kinase n=1 Tax=Gryllus longicercus TaxID=2509291 RepID=A0AAN9V9F6_9ORTH